MLSGTALKKIKAKDILIAIFKKAGMARFTDYSLLAAKMSDNAVHQEVRDKLDAIAKKFKIIS